MRTPHGRGPEPRTAELEADAQGPFAASQRGAAAEALPGEPQPWLPHLQALAQQLWEQQAELLAHLELLEVRQRQQHMELVRRLGDTGAVCEREPSTAGLQVSREGMEAIRQLVSDLLTQHRAEVNEMQKAHEDQLLVIMQKHEPCPPAMQSAMSPSAEPERRTRSKGSCDSLKSEEEDDAFSPERAMRRQQTMASRADQRRTSQAIVGAYEAIQRHASTGVTGRQGVRAKPVEPRLMSASLVVVFANMVFLGVELDTRIDAARSGRPPPEWVFWAGMLFTAYFTAEMVARVALERNAFHRGPNRTQNGLDLLLVLAGWIDTIFSAVDLSTFRVLRVHLILRSVRILRFVGSMKRLRLVVIALMHSAYIALWAFVLLAVVLYMFVMLLLQGVEQHARTANEEASDSLYEYYGSVARAMVCLFMAITGGREWAELVEPLQQVSSFHVGLFVSYIAFAVIFILNLLTAIFVERMSQIAKADSHLARQEELDQDRRIVDLIRDCFKGEEDDESASPIIGRWELECLLGGKEVLHHLDTMGVGAAQVLALYDLLVNEELGGVDREELVCALTRLKNSATGVDVATLMFENQRINRQICALMRIVENEFAQLDRALNRSPAWGGESGHPAGANSLRSWRR